MKKKISVLTIDGAPYTVHKISTWLRNNEIADNWTCHSKYYFCLVILNKWMNNNNNWLILQHI